MSVADLPHVNAVINTTVAAILLWALWLIRQGRREAHTRAMLAALILSGLFLVSYLIYHYGHGSTPFPGQGWIRPVYFTVLITHTVLAVVNLPFIIVTVARALKGEFAKHRKVAKFTWYAWFYVAVTGPVVYLMLYQLYPATAEAESVVFERALALHQQDKLEEALALYKQAEREGRISARCFRAVVEDRIHEREKAMPVLERALEEAPKDVYCLVLRGRELIYSNKLDEAKEQLERAVSISPNNAFAQASAGFVFFRKYEYERAATAFERAAQLEPKNVTHKANAGYAHYLYGNYKAARPLYKRAIEEGLSGELLERAQEGLGVIDGGIWMCPMHAHETGKPGSHCDVCKMPLEPVSRGVPD